MKGSKEHLFIRTQIHKHTNKTKQNKKAQKLRILRKMCFSTDLGWSDSPIYTPHMPSFLMSALFRR